jgi:hypothetical protein
MGNIFQRIIPLQNIKENENIYRNNLINNVKYSIKPIEIGNKYTIRNGENYWSEFCGPKLVAEVSDINNNNIVFKIDNLNSFTVSKKDLSNEIVF